MKNPLGSFANRFLSLAQHHVIAARARTLRVEQYAFCQAQMSSELDFTCARVSACVHTHRHTKARASDHPMAFVKHLPSCLLDYRLNESEEFPVLQNHVLTLIFSGNHGEIGKVEMEVSSPHLASSLQRPSPSARWSFVPHSTLLLSSPAQRHKRRLCSVLSWVLAARAP